jgi:membrane protein implicated in regulation of membrane protease activity
MGKGAISEPLEILVIYADNGGGMFSMGLKDLLPQVLTSWQVWATIFALIIYMYLVGFVARTYHRPRSSKPKRKKKKEAATGEPAITEEETGSAA